MKIDMKQNNINKQIIEDLKKYEDKEYLKFNSSLIPTLDKKNFIGVRIPIIRKLSKKYTKHKDINIFLNDLPHNFSEEDNLHALIICENKNYEQTIKELDKFLPYVNNWATCDLMNPKSFKNNIEALKKDILRWIKSNKCYTVRFGIEMIMTYFLGENYDASLMKRVSQITSEEYYINMMIAWYFATALAKNWKETIPYIKNHKLSVWVNNKSIQKAIESRRITKEQKDYLRNFKIK